MLCGPAGRASETERVPVAEVIGAIVLVLALILAAVLAVVVTRWALHMND